MACVKKQAGRRSEQDDSQNVPPGRMKLNMNAQRGEAAIKGLKSRHLR
jgi:hypothetical protein